MAGYANRTIRLDFPELAEEGDTIWVTIRNPRLVPPDELQAAARKAKAAVPAADNPDPDAEQDAEDAAEMKASYSVFAKLVIGWHVYDATSTDDEQPPLGLPASPGLIAKLPLEILNRMGEELAKINPQRPTESQEAATSTTS